MKKTNKLLLTLLLVALAAALLAVGFTAAAEEPTIVAEDTCGQYGWYGNMVTFTLNSEGLLTFRGSGPIASGNPDVDGDFSYPRLSTQGPVREVVIEDGVTSVPRFCNQTYLTKATIGNSVTKISEDEELFGTFSGCSALTSVNLPDGLEFIGDRAFENCTALKNIELPAGLTEVLRGAFSGCTALQNVFYAGTQEQWNELFIYYDEYADDRNAPLLNANIYYNVVDWGYCGAEGNEESLTWVFTNDGTLTISGTGPMGAFRQNGHYVMIGVVGPTAKRVRKVVVEEGVTSLPEQAFIGVDRYLEEVILPASLETIGAWAFYHLEGLRSVTIPENSQLTTIGSAAFSGDSSLTSFRIPEGVTTIENGAFYQVPLTELTIPGSVTTIGNAAFDGGYSDEQAVFTTVTIPATVTSIGSNAFRKAVVIYGYAGSAAEGFAAENGNVFIALCPTEHQNAYEVPATEATEAAHGYTAGVFCPDCETWLSGHDVIHNALGEQRVIKEPTETEEGIIDIRCTVCGEWGRYTADPTGSQPDDNSGGFWAQIQSFFRGIIDWFLRLFKWLG